MDIRNWPMNRIMQLPDCCFGRRWLVACAAETAEAGDEYAIVGAGMPDRAVIWEINVTMEFAITQVVGLEFAWAERLVTTAAEWSGLQKMFPCQGQKDGADYNFWASSGSSVITANLKLPSPALGKRPSVRLDDGSTSGKDVTVYFTISSLPTEVPDWLNLAKASYP